MANEEIVIIRSFKQIQRNDWIKRYTRFNMRLSRKYEDQRYSIAHKKEWESTYKRILKNWRAHVTNGNNVCISCGERLLGRYEKSN